jgi:hypothetical protein
VKRRVWLAAAGLAAGMVMAFALEGEGVSTRSTTLDTATELSAGVLDRVAVTSDGTVVLGEELTRVAPPEPVGSVWSLLELPDGSVLAGTGVEGRVYRIEGGRATRWAETGAVVVTSLTRGEDGAVYAGTLPDGKVFRLVPPRGETLQAPVLVAELPGVQHVWSVAWDARRHVLLCATGPEGKLFSVDPRRPAGEAATVLFDSDEPHLYAMALRADGEVILGGGGGHAVVYGLRATGRPRVIARLAGDEVKGLAVADDDVVAIANEFSEAPEPPRRTVAQSRLPAAGGPSAARARPGRGALYRIRPSGLAERVYATADSHLSAVQWDPRRREVWLGLGVGGRVLAVAGDRTVRVAHDVDEAGVTALALTGRARMFATSDTGVFYRVLDRAPTAATWNSRVIDATSPASWGAVRARGAGAFAWESRAGNAEAPDATWSAWEALEEGTTVRSPSSRYLQVRARFPTTGDAVLRAVTVFYLPENQRAVVTDLSATQAETKAGEARSPVLKLAWKVENPDNDGLRYRLYFRGDGDQTWRSLLRNQEWVTGTSFDWATDGLAEGWYRVEVDASDEAANTDDSVTRDVRVSEPVLVDNTPPTVRARVEGDRVRGEAADGASVVLRVEVSVDGGEWRALRADDGVLDEATEAFAGALPPAGVRAGEHVLSVRAADEAGNVGVGSVRYRR